MHFTAHRTRPAKFVVGALALVLLAAGVVYFSGTYDRWRLARACGGTVDSDSLHEFLGGDQWHEAGHLGDMPGSLAQCRVLPDDDSLPALSIDVRWGSEAVAGTLFSGRTDLFGGVGSAEPLGGWPGVMARGASGYDASVALPCGNRKNESIVVGTNALPGSGPSGPDDGELRAELAQVTVRSAQQAAEKFGCEVPKSAEGPVDEDGPKIGPIPENLVSRVYDNPAAAAPLAEAKGTCAALRPLAADATRAGAPGFTESAAQPNAPLADCFLLTPKNVPGYGLSATYGPYAKAFREGVRGTDGELRLESGAQPRARSGGGRSWATAQCPGSSERALFLMWRVFDTSNHTHPVNKPAPAFEAAALKAFATDAAKQHGCTDLRLP